VLKIGEFNMNINLNTRIYPLESILNTCYNFIERAYIFLDVGPKPEFIKISFKAKNRSTQRQLGSLHGEFMNELLHSILRYAVSKNNKKIREYIIGRALYAVLPTSDLFTTDKKLDYQEDPLGITVPWEEKDGKKNKKKNKKNAKAKV
jgi:His-Xaa-Ser system protein HxsD